MKHYTRRKYARKREQSIVSLDRPGISHCGSTRGVCRFAKSWYIHDVSVPSDFRGQAQAAHWVRSGRAERACRLTRHHEREVRSFITMGKPLLHRTYYAY